MGTMRRFATPSLFGRLQRWLHSQSDLFVTRVGRAQISSISDDLVTIRSLIRKVTELNLIPSPSSGGLASLSSLSSLSSLRSRTHLGMKAGDSLTAPLRYRPEKATLAGSTLRVRSVSTLAIPLFDCPVQVTIQHVRKYFLVLTTTKHLFLYLSIFSNTP